MMNRLGKPEAMMPVWVLGPFFQWSFRLLPFRPRMSIFEVAPVTASKPVARTMMSTSYSVSPTNITWLPGRPAAIVGPGVMMRRVTSQPAPSV